MEGEKRGLRGAVWPRSPRLRAAENAQEEGGALRAHGWTAPRPRARCGCRGAASRPAQRLTCGHPSRGQGQEAGEPKDAAEDRPEGRGHGCAGSGRSAEGTRLTRRLRPLLGARGAGYAGRCGSGARSSSPRDAESLRAAAAHSPPRRPRPASAAPRRAPSPRPSLPSPYPSFPHEPPPSRVRAASRAPSPPLFSPPFAPLLPTILPSPVCAPPVCAASPRPRPPPLTQRPQRRAPRCKAMRRPLWVLLQLPYLLLTHTIWRATHSRGAPTACEALGRGTASTPDPS